MCYHPWVGLDISPQGGLKPCCKYTNNIAASLNEYNNSNELKDLRAQFLNGIKPPGCIRCWQDEDAGLPSKRQLDWEYVFNNTAPPIDKLAVLSVPMGNTCNLACRTCNSAFSSKWVADETKLKDHFPIVVHKHHKFYKDLEFMQGIIDSASNLIRVEFPGGEPLLTGVEQHLEFLDHVPYGASLHYATNGTIFPSDKFISRWKKYRHVDIQLSIDGVGKHFEYNRHPADWSECSSNYGKFKELQQLNSNIQLSISHTVSIFTVMYLPEMFKWCLKNKMPLPYLGPLLTPSHYSITTFPQHVKDAISKKLSNPKFEKVVKYMMAADNSKEFATTMKYVTLLDEQRNQSFAETFPELYQLIKGYTC